MIMIMNIAPVVQDNLENKGLAFNCIVPTLTCSSNLHSFPVGPSMVAVFAVNRSVP
jgi:hypothetical protein